MQQFKQSPIDIDTTKTINANHKISFNYFQESFHVMDTGLNISLMPINCQSYVIKNDKIYNLSEIHFHRPSEHHVNGDDFDMEVHLVHQESHSTLVYSILLKMDDNGINFGFPFANIDANISIDLSQLTPKSCWDYHGSFTTSPFDEIVIWLINQKPLTILTSQANALNSLYPNNNRCLQPINERDIFSVSSI